MQLVTSSVGSEAITNLHAAQIQRNIGAKRIVRKLPVNTFASFNHFWIISKKLLI